MRKTGGVTGNTRIMMYDNTGKPVRDLFNGKTDKGKQYKLLMDTRKYSQGIYFIQLRTGVSIVSEKLLIIR